MISVLLSPERRLHFSRLAFAINLFIFIGIFQPCNPSAKPASAPLAIDSAVTRDLDGNGYLDAVELYFNMPVEFPPDFPLGNILILQTVKTFAGNLPVAKLPFMTDSMEALDSIGTKYLLHFKEFTADMPDLAQTAWTPFLSIYGLTDSLVQTQCKDGAGPVVWRVTKIIKDDSDRRQDVVDVTFSEPIQGHDGRPFDPASVEPGALLVDSRQDGNGAWQTAIILDRIDSFSRMPNDSTLEFKMSNGNDLTANDFISINAAANLLYDSRFLSGGGEGIPPEKDNRKVQVQVVANRFPAQINVFPSPSWPTNMREPPGYFYLLNNPSARDWVRMDFSGIVVNFLVYIGADDSTVCGLKIYDSFGTEVAEAEPFNGRYLRNVASVSGTPVSDALVNVDIYWNGTTTNASNEYVHAGIYTAKFQFQRQGDKSPTVLQQEFYLRRNELSHSTCGGNYAIAFLPAVWLKTRKPLLSVLRKLFLKKSRPLC
jgi:hypothetical protein